MTDSAIASSITVHNLHFRFGETSVLDGISAKFESGQVSFLLGASGAGKTTLALILAGGLEPDTGFVAKLPDVMPRLVLQFPELLFLTDSVTEEWQIIGNQVSRNQAEQAMRMFGLALADLSTRSPRSLSFGQRRLLGLALQSAHSSPFLILDEPTLGLDEENLDRVVDWVRAESRHKLCLAITHDLPFIEKCPGIVIILNSGKIHWSGGSQEFLTSQELQFVAGFI